MRTSTILTTEDILIRSKTFHYRILEWDNGGIQAHIVYNGQHKVAGFGSDEGSYFDALRWVNEVLIPVVHGGRETL